MSSPGRLAVGRGAEMGLTGTAEAQRWPPLGFHLNNQLTQALTSRYRDSRLQVDFERFVSCAAQLTCIFRECRPGAGGPGGRRSPTRHGGCSARPLRTGHCSRQLEGGEGVVCLTRRQVSLGRRERLGAAGGRPPRGPLPRAGGPLSPSGWRWPPSPSSTCGRRRKSRRDPLRLCLARGAGALARCGGSERRRGSQPAWSGFWLQCPPAGRCWPRSSLHFSALCSPHPDAGMATALFSCRLRDLALGAWQERVPGSTHFYSHGDGDLPGPALLWEEVLPWLC